MNVIRVESIGKRYRVGAEAGGLLRDRIAGAFRHPLGTFRRKPRETFWALRDISFDVQEGEVLGLIGRNGAGKSTLLKILSRITKPTVGRAEIHGRVGSLLEVGTGFHPELSGRENVFLNGAILGMSRREIARKFDEIVAFAEVEKFIDTAVKHYSSGMYVRLAFAVAAHLETEILFVDEVLSVGDVSFQKKCLGKMGDVARQGRTIIFVSHNMTAINNLCSRSMMIRGGEVVCDGPTAEVTERYYGETLGRIKAGADVATLPREGTGKAKFVRLVVQPLDAAGNAVEVAYPGCDLKIEFDIECYRPIAASVAAAIIYDQNGFRVVDTNTGQKGKHVSLMPGQTATVSLLLRDLLLRPGEYFVGLWIGRHGVEFTDHVERAASLRIAEPASDSGHPIAYPGVYLCRFEENVSVS